MISTDIYLAYLFEQARSYCEEEKNLHAMQLYRQILFLNPALARGYLELASLYATMMNYELAIELLHDGLEILPENEELVFTIGEYYLHLTNYDEALGWFRKLEGKKIPHVHYNTGLALLGKNEFSAAEQQFRLTILLDPDFPRINGLLGEVLVKTNDPVEAIRYLKRESTRDPYYSMNHHFLGVAYATLGHWHQAYGEFTLAVDMDPDVADNWRWCGEALYHLQRYTEAEHYLRKALGLFPGCDKSRSILDRLEAEKDVRSRLLSSGKNASGFDTEDDHFTTNKSSRNMHRGKQQ
jgi:tetratricopeptide (TPR) repeat protein